MMKRSLRQQHPRQILVPIALILSTTLLLVGLSLPLMDAQTGILWKTWRSSYSVWAGVVALPSLANVQPREGVYVFGAAILASMLTTKYIARLAHRP